MGIRTKKELPGDTDGFPVSKHGRIQALPASHMVQMGKELVGNWDKDGVGGVGSGIRNSKVHTSQPDLLLCWK